ncbi:acrosin-like [Syngnathus acus]|uniref:acrosin-like n=1 Tax=Syngnathus acus TaxID=161584 RepID=UPI001886123C|nr:acrosin-like [Syngnathus acus]
MDMRVLALLLCVQLVQLLLSAPPSTEAMSIPGPPYRPPPAREMPRKKHRYSNCSWRPGGCGPLGQVIAVMEHRPPHPPPPPPPPPPPRPTPFKCFLNAGWK